MKKYLALEEIPLRMNPRLLESFGAVKEPDEIKAENGRKNTKKALIVKTRKGSLKNNIVNMDGEKVDETVE